MADKKNISSGAEKAEKLANKSSSKKTETKELESLADNGAKKTKASTAKSSPKKTAKKSIGDNKGKGNKRSSSNRKKGAKVNSDRIEKRAERKKQRLEKRLAHKKLTAERKQKRLEKKLEHRQKRAERIAELKEKRIERKEERAKRRDLLRSEDKEQRRQRIASERQARREAIQKRREQRLADKNAKREHKRKLRAQKSANRKDKNRTPGFGGWLAAVISLGVTTLALATVLTFGWISMDGMQANMAGGYTQSLYELNSVVDDLDVELAKARASSSNDRIGVLCDIAIDSENAETILERFPLEMQTTQRLASFINEMGNSAKGMLFTIANGGELNEMQIKQLEYMYETNAKVKSELNSLIEKTCEKEMLMAMRGKDCAMSDVFANIQNNVFGTPERARKLPSSTYLEGMEEITAQKAEELAKSYFSSYKVSSAKCTGEALGAIALYNVNLSTPDGEMLVQISKKGGKVVSFDSFKDCRQHNFSVDRCVDIAEEFLNKIGYTNLKAVWASENGTTCNLHFATIQDGVVIYSDLVKIKVCEERGIVTGAEAFGYVMRHKDRTIEEATLSEEQARSAINGNIEVSSTRLALIPQRHEERLCYEFFGEMGGVEYYVYVDANTGEELEVRTVIGTAQGKLIR
ncbi:MAG: PepSY1/2 domain-containing protein [Candidatus Coproplasma sp.]